MIEKPCPHCHGSGRERRIKTYTVKIQAGVKDGTRIRLKGKGEAGQNGGPAGDLIVITRVAPSHALRAARRRPRHRGAGRRMRRPRSARPSRCRHRTVPVSLKIPAGSEDGKLLRIKGRGAPKLSGSGKGDVLARVRIRSPRAEQGGARAPRGAEERRREALLDEDPDLLRQGRERRPSRRRRRRRASAGHEDVGGGTVAGGAASVSQSRRARQVVHLAVRLARHPAAWLISGWVAIALAVGGRDRLPVRLPRRGGSAT